MKSPDHATPARLLIVDDLPSIHDDYHKILDSTGRLAIDDQAVALFGHSASPIPMEAMRFQLDSAFQGQEGLALVQQSLAEGRPYAVAFVDMRMPPGWNGVDTIRHLWAADPRIEIVICTAYSDYSWSETVKSLGHHDNLIVLKKPFDQIEVQQLAHALARKWRLAREAEARIDGLDRLVSERTDKLRHAEQDFSTAFEANPLPQSIIALDRFEILAVNSSYRKAFGPDLPDLRHITPDNFGLGLEPGRLRELMGQLALGEPIDDHAFVYRPASGGPREMRCSARAISLHGRPCSIWVMRDVTEQLQLEQQVRHSQKMEAIGLLSAGVAHDFNNLLTVIHGFTEQALHEAPDDNARRLLLPIQSASTRATTLTRQLLLLTSKQAGELRPIDTVVVLRELQPLLRRLIPAHISVVFDLPDSLPAVLADTANLEQIVVNLVVNARDAIPARGGQIEISLSLRTFATPEATRHAEGRAGRFIALRVTDTGCGIPLENFSRIFEPFFTTKETGKGTGLGLSTVYSLARRHSGWVDVQSVVGHGTTFSIYQPVAPAFTPTARNGTHSASISPWAQAPVMHRVLAAEDDPSVQQLLRLLFDEFNIDGTIANDGPDALRIWERNEGKFDLLFTDMVMPNGMNGLDLARRLRAERPDLSVIVTTGYSRELLEPSQLEMPGERPQILMKPYALKDMIRAIRGISGSVACPAAVSAS